MRSCPVRKSSLVTGWIVLAWATGVGAQPTVTLSDGVLDDTGPTALYTFLATASAPVPSDVTVDLLNLNPTEYSAPASVVIPAGTSQTPIFVQAFFPSGSLAAPPSISISNVTGGVPGAGGGEASLPGAVPEISIQGGEFEVGTGWLFTLDSPAPLSADVFVPLQVDSPDYVIAGGGVVMLNGARTVEVVAAEVVASATPPTVSILAAAGFTIGVGVATGVSASVPGIGLTGALLVLGISAGVARREIGGRRHRRGR